MLEPFSQTSNNSQRRAMGFLVLLSLTHGVIDLGQGALVSLLPILREHYNLTYTMVGVIMLASQLTSSVAQPIFGILSDRAKRRWLLPLSLAFSGVGLASLGFMPSYGFLLVGVILAALAVATFHPEGAHSAHYLAGERRARAMAIYSVGGNIGNALGTVYITMLLYVVGGMHGTALAAILPIALAAVTLWLLPSLQAQEAASQKARAGRQAESTENHWAGAILITVVVMLRSVINLGVVSYIPFYWIDILGHSRSSAGYVQLMYLLAGVAGTLLGAPLADRVGTKRILVASFALLLPVQLLLPQLTGLGLLLALFGAGFLVVSTHTTTLVMTQEYMPRSLGLASGLNLGLAFGMGGVGTWLLGMVADRWGVLAVLWVIAVLVIPTVVLAAVLPPARKVAAKGD